jgi:hypothetical protein
MSEIFSLFDRYPAIPICGMAVLVLLGAAGWFKRKRGAKAASSLAAGLLGQVLFWWTPRDPFTVRDLLNGGCLILGRAGSGKTSSSGRTLMQAIVSNRRSGGLLIAAKPEDAEDVAAVFRRAGRKDLVVFDADSQWRFNFLDYVGRGEPRNVVQCLMMIGQTLRRGAARGGNDAAFWESMYERFLYNTVAALQAVAEPISADRILRFLMTAATSAAQQSDASWQKGYHNQVMLRADKTPKTKLVQHDWVLCRDFWVLEYPAMADKTRSSALAGVMNILHTFNTGLVREMVAGETNVTPDYILNGGWVLVNFPPSLGATHAFISTGWQYLTQLAILKRKATEASPFCVIWCDEAHQTVTSYDSSFIAQCRSHKGCLLYLTQSVSSFYSAMKGETGRHQADALLANFSHAIVHACDPVTAKWASAKLGREKEILCSGGFSPQADRTIYDELFGQNNYHGNFSEHYEQPLQDQEWMVGRTGGPGNGFVADAIVVRSGEPFADGKSYLRVVFSQR